MIDSGELVAALYESGALRRGHFLLSSGRHSSDYVQCALLLEHPSRARRVGAELSARLAGFDPDSVVSPALGGLVIGYQVASELDIAFRFVERVAGIMTLRRGFSLRRGERVVVVEDVVTTGRSTAEAIEAVEAVGGSVVAVGSIIDRTIDSRAFDCEYRPLLRLAMETYEPAECPLCQAGQAMEKPGSRREIQ